MDSAWARTAAEFYKDARLVTYTPVEAHFQGGFEASLNWIGLQKHMEMGSKLSPNREGIGSASLSKLTIDSYSQQDWIDSARQCSRKQGGLFLNIILKQGVGFWFSFIWWSGFGIEDYCLLIILCKQYILFLSFSLFQGLQHVKPLSRESSATPVQMIRRMSTPRVESPRLDSYRYSLLNLEETLENDLGNSTLVLTPQLQKQN